MQSYKEEKGKHIKCCTLIWKNLWWHNAIEFTAKPVNQQTDPSLRPMGFGPTL